MNSRDRATEESKRHQALKRFQIVLALVIAAAFLVSIAVVMLEELRSPSGVSTGTVNCPLRIRVHGNPYSADQGQVVPWRIFTSGSDNDAPKIVVSTDADVHPPDSSSPSCDLNIVKLPGKKLSGVEWRIGYVLNDPSVARGKTAHISFMLKANLPITFGAASIYSYDGSQIRSAHVPYLYQKWERFVLESEVARSATTFEVWLRLDLGSQISNEGTVYMSNVRIDFN